VSWGGDAPDIYSDATRLVQEVFGGGMAGLGRMLYIDYSYLGDGMIEPIGKYIVLDQQMVDLASVSIQICIIALHKWVVSQLAPKIGNVLLAPFGECHQKLMASSEYTA
jgi:hypothetical protein